MDNIDPEFIRKAMEGGNNCRRKERNKLLIETDRFVLPDYPVTPENLIIIKNYRQSLRDISQNNFQLPEIPSILANYITYNN